MGTEVSDEAAFGGESATTAVVRTDERSLAGVRAFVRLQVVRCSERLSTTAFLTP